jgi:hypothetical protein
MTTCVNQEKKGYAGKAVSATLAGVLAVGMVPAAAFAEAGSDEAAEDASVETLATVDQNIGQGSISGAKITKSGADDKTADLTSGVTVAVGETLVPTEITPKYGSAIDLTSSSNKDAYVTRYWTDTDAKGTFNSGDTVLESAPNAAGKYIVTVASKDVDEQYLESLDYVAYTSNSSTLKPDADEYQSAEYQKAAQKLADYNAAVEAWIAEETTAEKYVATDNVKSTYTSWQESNSGKTADDYVAGDGKSAYETWVATFSEEGYNTAKKTTAPTFNPSSVTSPYSIYNSAKQYVSLAFTVSGKTLQDVVSVCGETNSTADADVTSFTYNAAAQKVYVAVDGVVDSNVKIVITAKGAVKPESSAISSATSSATVTNAGKYVATIIAQNGSDYNSQTATVEFEVAALDLSKANLTLDDVAESNATAEPTIESVKLDGAALSSDLKRVLQLERKDGQDLYGETGSYTYTVSKITSTDTNITGTKDITFAIAETSLARFMYYGSGTSGNVIGTNITTSNGLEVVHNDETKDEDFDASKIKVIYKDANDNDKLLSTDQFEVTAVDADGNAVELSALKNAGEYTVTVKVLAEKTDYQYCGSQSFKVSVTDGEISTATVYASYDKKLYDAADSVSDTYTGSDLSSKISISVEDNKNNVLTQGTDFNLVFKKTVGSEKVVVDKIVDAGTYTVSLTSDKFAIKNSGNTVDSVDVLTIVVSPATISDIELSNSKEANDRTDYEWYAYTGFEITPAFEYYTAAALKAAKDDVTKVAWSDLASDVYTVTYKYSADGTDYKKADSVKEVGYYQATIALAKTDAAGNFKLDSNATTTITFQVAKATPFKDVPTDAWYATSVAAANDLGYMTGKTNQLFGPNDTLTRAEAVTILHKMADADAALYENMGEGTVNNMYGYTTSFSDVDSNIWYAGHVQWAEKSGITTGYGDGTFGPDDQITREQWATMLARYDKIFGDYSAGTAAKVNAFPDSSAVSDWAAEAVQWAVNEGIITGKNGLIAPTAKITRAEAATMAVRYQPERID